MAKHIQEEKYVYLVQEVSPSNTPTKYYTVGEAENRRKGVKQLQVGNPRHLQMISSTKLQVAQGTEDLVHKQFISMNVHGYHHGGTKWYHCKKEREIKLKFREALLGTEIENCHVD